MGRDSFPKFFKKKNINIIEDSSEENCYKIEVELSDSGSNILIISSYPKKANSRICIRFLRRIISFINDKHFDYFEKGIKSISIVNLFSSYENNLNKEGYLDSINKNDEVIRICISDSDVIIAAWGEPLKIDKKVYRERITDILELIRDDFLNSNIKKLFLKVGKSTKLGYPKHCFAWDSDDELNNFFN